MKIYKKYFIKAVLILSSFLALGCQDLDENPKADLTPDNYFKTQKDLDGAVASIYEKLARDGAWGFTNRMTSYFGSDDLTTDPGLNKQDMRDFDRLAGGSGNANLVAQWNGPWLAIYQANNVLDNYEKVNSNEEAKLASA